MRVGDGREGSTVCEWRLGSGHPVPSSGWHGVSGAHEEPDDGGDGGAALGRSPGARARIERQAQAASRRRGGGGGSDVEGVRAAVHRRLCQSQPRETQCDRREGLDFAGASGSAVRRHGARRNHHPGRAADEGRAECQGREDRQQRADGAERAVEDRRVVGRDRPHAVRGHACANHRPGDEVSRLRELRAVGRGRASGRHPGARRGAAGRACGSPAVARSWRSSGRTWISRRGN